jgi:hypothetical protein
MAHKSRRRFGLEARQIHGDFEGRSGDQVGVGGRGEGRRQWKWKCTAKAIGGSCPAAAQSASGVVWAAAENARTKKPSARWGRGGRIPGLWA